MDATSLRSVAAAIGRRWWLLLLVLITTLGAVGFYTVTSHPSYLARATLIISPSSTVDRGDLVYSVDSLGRGRIVGTYVEVLGSEVLQQRVLDRLGYPPNSLNRAILFKVSSIADTAVIQVTAEGPEPEISARAANAIGDAGIEQMGDLYPVYSLRFLTNATPPLLPYRPDPVRNYSLGALVGLVLGGAVAFLLDLALRHRAGTAPLIEEGELDALSHEATTLPEPRALPPGRPVGRRGAGGPRSSQITVNGHQVDAESDLAHGSTNGSVDSPLDGTKDTEPSRPSFDDIEARLNQLQVRLRGAPVAPGGTRAARAEPSEKSADE